MFTWFYFRIVASSIGSILINIFETYLIILFNKVCFGKHQQFLVSNQLNIRKGSLSNIFEVISILDNLCVSFGSLENPLREEVPFDA